ncbi:MAG TPA: hypothetical protein VK424_08060 [Thermoplasmata archaeon]|nr:hypothetical protein [Thermoplasmata archaeon]
MPKVDLSGAYGIATPPPAAALANHPERVLRYSRMMALVWGLRLGAVAVLLYLLYLSHVIQP